MVGVFFDLSDYRFGSTTKEFIQEMRTFLYIRKVQKVSVLLKDFTVR